MHPPPPETLCPLPPPKSLRPLPLPLFLPQSLGTLLGFNFRLGITGKAITLDPTRRLRNQKCITINV
jgi:hypothetical protein